MLCRLLCVCLATLVACQDHGTTVPPAPTNREDLMNTWVATYYSEDDCLTAPEWDTLWDFYDSDDDGYISVQEFHDNDMNAPILGEPYGAQAIFDFHDRAMGEPDGIVVASEASNYTYHFMDVNENGCVTENEFRTQLVCCMPEILDEGTRIRDELAAAAVGK